jgi:cytochrome c nitrite reductase small subunit
VLFSSPRSFTGGCTKESRPLFGRSAVTQALGVAILGSGFDDPDRSEQVQRQRSVRAGRVLGAALVLATGICLGLSGYTFYYARGAAYLSDDPRACVNCHVMREQYDGWAKSSHHAVATCNDCHVPHDFLGKYLAKASNGYHHSRAFTFQDFPDPIRIKPGNAALLQANCVRCHEPMVGEVLRGGSGRGEELGCAQCHSGVGHGPRR